ncbi:lipid A deacylase LpxR family protein [Dyadobacter sp. NIV53]|uniref:lipid A deacylase LpxR family protein n=1 Tax=Dyadobacter sp. NIV53 TaxID=2861765 RepID=UPI001C87888E|nr:lipid A deacylase LpxR family protein [Dyadobacter sp. NIV53]
MQKRFIILLFNVLLPAIIQAQRIDNTASFRNMAGDKYFRIHYDNDFWGKSDYYYTQGYDLELVHPSLGNNPVSKVLFRLQNSQSTYGLAFEHYGFTPTSIKSNKILVGDRPFAGVIMLKSFAVSVDTPRKQRLVSTLSTGMLGPAAFAGKMQATIHGWTGDTDPQGWQYQIKNDVVINYELSHEKELLNYPNIISLNTNVQARLGTLSNKIQTGFTMTLGRFHSPFNSSRLVGLRNFQIYIYNQPLVGLVGYDATMQGGIFNKNSPYTLKASEINRITLQNNFGLVATFWKIYFEYYRTYLSREFKNGREHRWGGIKIGVAF